ncbi:MULTISPECIES: P-type ATPase [Parachlamydia]|jgi:cation transport ATPase|uniref:Uncharacterized protein n=2 Tax=Parachlamydia acanthamoebae TaxID=83552 RepID=F8KY07_PARAV|nr:hypothetical protein [Parachlamydia acanthamoebae]EFB40113.1 hypothetical protein pah_c260o012 [Parachlamydia acanthamoebae str. Hall's coccus]KIA78509.1 hypothetical protein DB43_DW00050 [Parachlamydia acanthamoebae]CCB85746.1 putative uncharacterized protein [Parachlamydia acanthamoebae UV-7]
MKLGDGKKVLLILCLAACFLCLPFFVQIGGMLTGRQIFISENIQFILATLIQLIGGFLFYWQAYHALRKRQVGHKTVLMMISTVVYLYSCVLWQQNLPSFFMVSAITITVLLLGEWLLVGKQRNQIDLLPKVFADRLAHVLLGVITLSSVIAFLTWWLIKGNGWRACGIGADVWVMACPCMLGLAMPIIINIYNRTVAWLKENLEEELAIAKAEDVSKEAIRKMRQNVGFAFLYPVLGIPFAAMGLLHPWLVAFTIAMSFFSIFTNSLLLYFWLPQENNRG